VLKPRFYRPTQEHLVKATSAWERVSVDFKGPIVTSPRGNRFLFVVVDEYSRFPFAFACKDTSASSVVKCPFKLCSLFGFSPYVHSDRGTAFLSRELKDYLHSRGIATSHSTSDHSTGNSQSERCNQTIWKTISLMIKGRNLGPHYWKEVLPEALHSVRTLLSTATNTTPHELFLPFPRRSMLGRSLPTWLITPNTVLLKIVRNKSEPLRDEVELLDANPKTALVRFPDGRESTVSVSDLAPLSDMSDHEPCDVPETTTENRTSDTETVQSETGQNGHAGMTLPRQIKRLICTINLRRVFGGRLELVRPPDRFGDYVSHRFCALMNVCRTEL